MTPNQFTYRVWTASRTLTHGQRPTKKHVRVARALARHPSKMPSHRQLARSAECCVRTVQNALNRFKLELGLIEWRHVFDRRMRPSDRRRQRANLYLFSMPLPFNCPALPGRQTSEARQMPAPTRGWLALERRLAGLQDVTAHLRPGPMGRHDDSSVASG